ncbi:MAG TPA: DUF4252 domain-containing protein [Cyclobacteriaceae bacterium]|nr:DUF4252 domain-containing protein [Cyclobacteriaceae bacterium]
MKRNDRYAAARRKGRQEQMMNKATADITHNMMMNTKLIGLTLVILTMSVTAQAQNDAISRFFDKYAGDDSFTQVTVSSKMFSLFTDMEAETPEDKEVLEAISKLKGIRIIAKDNARNARELYREAFALIPKSDYQELMSVRDDRKDMKFMIREDGDKISELLMVMGGPEEFMVLSVFGEIDLKQISRIGRKMNVSGLEKLEGMDKKSSKSAPTSKDNK